MMRYEIFHETKFEYGSIVTFSHNIARLKPLDLPTQKLLEHSLSLDASGFELSEFEDFLGNTNTHLLIKEAHDTLVVTARSVVELDVEKINQEIKSQLANTLSYAELLERLKSFHPDDIYAKQFLFDSDFIQKASKELNSYVLESFGAQKPLIQSTLEFAQRVFKEFTFVSGFSDVNTPVETIFKAKKGVCQDFAQLCISALRSIGIPTRYVSGYIQTLPPPGKEKLFGADASHAWFSIYVPDLGWVEFDPTNNKMPNEEYVILGYGRDYSDIAPLKGVVQSSGLGRVSVQVNVAKVELTTQKQTQSQSTIQPLQS